MHTVPGIIMKKSRETTGIEDYKSAIFYLIIN